MKQHTKDIHKYMLEHQAAVGEPPTLQRIADHIEGLNYRSSVYAYMRDMEEDGLVEQARDPFMSRRWKAV